MRILLVADMRDPHAINWVQGLLDMGIHVNSVSSRRLGRLRLSLPQRVVRTIVHEASGPIARSRAALTNVSPLLELARRVNRGTTSITSQSAPRSEGTGWMEFPLEVQSALSLGVKIAELAAEYNSDLIHALRVPFEGIAVSRAPIGVPYAVSLWGSDLVRQASGHLRLGDLTRATLAGASGIHADCARDVRLLQDWGATAHAKVLLAPGNMGVDTSVFRQVVPRHQRDLVVFPRGASPSVNWPGFLEAVSGLVDRHSQVQFVGVRLAGNALAQRIKATLPDPTRLILTPNLPQSQLADVLMRAVAVLSPSTGDGTPNSVLEGMACGALPIVGDIEPLRDLLTDVAPDGLIDPLDSSALGSAIDHTLQMSQTEWMESSRAVSSIVRQDWSRSSTMPRVHAWYEGLHGKGSS